MTQLDHFIMQVGSSKYRSQMGSGSSQGHVPLLKVGGHTDGSFVSPTDEKEGVLQPTLESASPSVGKLDREGNLIAELYKAHHLQAGAPEIAHLGGPVGDRGEGQYLHV